MQSHTVVHALIKIYNMNLGISKLSFLYDLCCQAVQINQTVISALIYSSSLTNDKDHYYFLNKVHVCW